MSEGQFTISTRVYLSIEQRAKLEQLLYAQSRELDDLLTELLAGYLAEQPEPPVAASAHEGQLRAELRARRAELRRLEPRLHEAHNPPPPWLIQLVADLRQEIGRIEGELG